MSIPANEMLYRKCYNGAKSDDDLQDDACIIEYN